MQSTKYICNLVKPVPSHLGRSVGPVGCRSVNPPSCFEACRVQLVIGFRSMQCREEDGKYYYYWEIVMLIPI